MQEKKIIGYTFFVLYLLMLIPSYALYEDLSGNFTIEERFYVTHAESIRSIVFIIPFEEYFSDFVISSCVNCSYEYNGTHIIAKVDLNSLHEGMNSILISGSLRQRVVLPHKVYDLQELNKYKISTKNIQSNLEEIKNISSSIMRSCRGDKKCFIIKSVEWINDYLTYDVRYGDKNYNTQWILKNKKGVCAEYTTLFISIMRSQGIPSRYVSVLAYDVKEKTLVPHAYAEVYLDGFWYPIDVLWKQIGYVDALHIHRSYSQDNNVESNINVSYWNDIEFKWLDEKITLTNANIKINNSYFDIENSTLYVESRKITNVSLNVSRQGQLKDACLYVRINPCIGSNISIYPKEGFACDVLNFSIILYDKNVVCPVVLQYDTKFSVVNISTSKTLSGFEYFKEYIHDSQSEDFISSLIDSLRKLFNMIVSLINSLW